MATTSGSRSTMRGRQERAAFEVVDDVVEHARRLGERRHAGVLHRFVVRPVDEPRPRHVARRDGARDDRQPPLFRPVADDGIDVLA
jgi:hypothetical protein